MHDPWLSDSELLQDAALGLVTDTESILHFSEFGVIFLMFVIGLELQPSRLWVLRRSVFGLGSLQLFLTTGIVMAIAMAFGLSWQISLLVGLAVTMSSTALVLQSLGEKAAFRSARARFFCRFAVSRFSGYPYLGIAAIARTKFWGQRI